jgi:hypothetical protein
MGTSSRGLAMDVTLFLTRRKASLMGVLRPANGSLSESESGDGGPMLRGR